MPDKEAYQFDECKTCEKFPCYIEGLYQWNGVCMDYEEHIEKPCCEQGEGCSRLKAIIERIEKLEKILPKFINHYAENLTYITQNTEMWDFSIEDCEDMLNKLEGAT